MGSEETFEGNNESASSERSWLMGVRRLGRGISGGSDSALVNQAQAWIAQAEDDFPTADDVPDYHDRWSDMTIGRRMARMFSIFSWYNPQAEARKEYESLSQEESAEVAAESITPPPSLDAAWAFFEHVTLARFFDEEAEDGTRVARRAEPGETECPTKLYSVWGTTESDIAEFGTGVGIYFYKLRAVTIIAFIAGLLSLPSILYYSSTNYSADGQDSIIFWIRGSAICTDRTWEPCPTCTKGQWNHSAPAFDRHAGTSTADGLHLNFILKNNCSIGLITGASAWCAMIFVIISIFVLGQLSARREVELDEAVQTASDYSIEIDNPPKDAYDPEEWKQFFSQFGGHVTCCTVALDNEHLTRALATRRTLLDELGMLLPPGVKLDQYNLDQAVENAIPLPWYMRFLYSDAATLKKNIEGLTEKALAMGEEHNDVVEVFVTFESEETQRKVLTAFSLPNIDVFIQRKSSLPPEYLFRGEHVLSIKEPGEPSSVRWQDLDESFITKVVQRAISFALTFACIIASVFAIYYCRQRYGAFITAIVVTGLNTGAPMITPYINNLESHRNEGSSQASLYIKNTLFMWMNTSVITNLITPFADTINKGSYAMIPGMYAIFLTEMLKTPVSTIVDPYGHFRRHYLAPRALDQRRMNLNFVGSGWHLSQRETDLANVIFLTFYYSSIFPSGFFFGTLTFIVHYWVDKFCLLRVWSRAPLIGTGISAFSRHYFFTSAVMIFAIISSYNFSAFPFDNACEKSSEVSSEYIGTFNATDGENKTHIITIEPGAKTYAFCDQDLLEFNDLKFPALPSKQTNDAHWMENEQTFVATVFGWTSVVVVIVILSCMVLRAVFQTIREWFGSPYTPSGRAMDINFSDIKEKFAYVPQIRVPQLTFPLIACDVSDIDEGLIGWSDPLHSHTYHNIIYDIPALSKKAIEKVGLRMSSRELGSLDEGPKRNFSVIKHWPPEN